MENYSTSAAREEEWHPHPLNQELEFGTSSVANYNIANDWLISNYST